MTVIVAYPTADNHSASGASRARPSSRSPGWSEANVIQFPAERCRQPATAIEAAERAAYELAAMQYATKPGRAASIETMMRLACEGTCEVARPLAAAWLLAQCGVTVRYEAA